MHFIIKIASTVLQDFHCVDILVVPKSIFLAFKFPPFMFEVFPLRMARRPRNG